MPTSENIPWEKKLNTVYVIFSILLFFQSGVFVKKIKKFEQQHSIDRQKNSEQHHKSDQVLLSIFDKEIFDGFGFKKNWTSYH